MCVRYLSFVFRGAFLKQLRTKAGYLFLYGQHDVGVVLVSLELIGQCGHAVPHKLIIPCEVGLDSLKNKPTFSQDPASPSCDSNGSHLLAKQGPVSTHFKDFIPLTGVTISCSL